MCCPLVFEFSVGIGVFVIGLGQISFFFSSNNKLKQIRTDALNTIGNDDTAEVAINEMTKRMKGSKEIFDQDCSNLKQTFDRTNPMATVNGNYRNMGGDRPRPGIIHIKPGPMYAYLHV